MLREQCPMTQRPIVWTLVIAVCTSLLEPMRVQCVDLANICVSPIAIAGPK